MPEKSPPPPNSSWQSIFSGLTGLWLALALIKFGNPIILNERIHAPSSLFELLNYPWPADWGNVLLSVVCLVSLRFWSWRTSVPTWFLALPSAWFVWQSISALQTIDPSLTSPTLQHFGSCVVAFSVGLFAFPRLTRLRPFWIGLLGGVAAVLIVGWKQHFGGLEAARDYFFRLPNWQEYSPEFVQKVKSDRIYSTLVYPNAFAGVILLLLPITLGKLWEVGMGWGQWTRSALVSVVGSVGLACLWWSGSKAGWVIMSVIGLLAFLRFTKSSVFSLLLIGFILAMATTGFWFRYQGYFGRGATSVSARVGYWKSAWHSLRAEPIFGSGPGTFMVVYRSQKLPEMEMARLAHNDFLQQGSDSGWIGLVTYMGWLVGGLCLLYRRSKRSVLHFCSWLGLVGIMAQACVEFWLYVPALSWNVFFLLGWQLGHGKAGNGIDNPRPSP